MEKLLSAIFTLVGFAVGVAIILALLAYPIKWLWNGCLVGAIDGIHDITALQALGIAVLTACLFKTATPSIIENER